MDAEGQPQRIVQGIVIRLYNQMAQVETRISPGG